MTLSVGNDTALAFGLLFARAGCVMMALPQLLGVSIPVRVRIGLGLLLTIALMPLASVAMPASPGVLAIAILVMRELVIGALLSISAAVVVGAVATVGDVVGSAMTLHSGGILRGVVVAPNTLADGLGALAGLLFFVGGFHRALILALGRSLTAAPLGTLAMPPPAAIVAIGGRLFAIALELGLPLLVPLFVLSLAQGVVARLAPQVNILVAAPAAMILAGLTLIALDCSGLGTGMMRAWSSVMTQATGWLDA